MKQQDPPRWALAIFRWFCNDHLSDAVLGDLLELYDRRCATIGKRKADLLFIVNVIQFIQPFAIRKKRTSHSLNTYDMLRNYITIAWRNMQRHKMYTGITIGGFALGLATCMVIFLFIRHEVSFDKHYEATNRIFRLYNDFTEPGDTDRWTAIQTPLARVLRQELPDIERIARVTTGLGHSGSNTVRRDDELENSFEDKFIYADPDILEILEIPMIHGNHKALEQPRTMVISRTKAKQFFGDTDPLGKVLILDDDKQNPYTVAGVMEDYRKDSHFQFDYILTLTEIEFWTGEQTDWCCWNYEAYIKLKEGVEVAGFEKKLIPIRDNFVIAYLDKIGDQRIENFRKYHAFRLQPVGDIYLHPEYNDSGPHGDVQYTWVSGAIAAVILILAGINFVNLSTAKSANRAKEVGLRKVVGSLRRSLILQFLTESVVYSLVSFVFGCVILWLALPSFNLLAGRSITIPWNEWWLLPALLMIVVLIGVVAGLYPAFYLSAFRPINIIKGNLAKGAKGSGLRSIMVVFQFTASIILMIGTFVIYRQMNYIMTRDVGFGKDQVMIIEGTWPIGDRRQVFKEELLKISGIESVSVSNYIPVDGGLGEGYGFFNEGREKIDKSAPGSKYRVDADYISTMRMKIIKGRDFDRNMASDSQATIVNEAMVRELGLKEPIGARISNGHQVHTIIGVVQDFNTTTMRVPIRPLSMVLEAGGEGSMTVLISSKDLSNTIESIERTWHRVVPNQPFRYAFMDERFAHMYDDVIRTGRVFASFSALAIIVACLGLLALSAFVTEQRGKEISIRRVMGASIQNIFVLLTGNFMKLVMISWVIGTPLAWYAMNEWLNGFSFREPIASDILIASGIIVALIALTTVAWQSIKAAVANPVENLRQN